MTTLKHLNKLNELAVAQENGATLESYGVITHKWHEIGRLVELNLNLLGEIRIQQPEIARTDIEWCGYCVPDIGVNCDVYRTSDGRIITFQPAYLNKHINNGYRHLYRYKHPRVVPYTLDTLPIDRPSWVKSKTANTRPTIEYADESGVTILRTHHTYAEAMKIVDWPDGTPFGVEVSNAR